MTNFLGMHGVDNNAIHYLSVLEAEQLETPVDYITAGYGLDIAKHWMHRVTPQCEARLMAAPLSSRSGQGNHTAARFMQDFQADYVDVPSDFGTVLMLPMPIAQLVVSANWSTVSLSCNMKMPKNTEFYENLWSKCTEWDGVQSGMIARCMGPWQTYGKEDMNIK